MALATAAAASLLLLAEAWLHSQQAGGIQTDRFFQAALTGTGYFVVSALVHQLAVRLGREEQRAQRSQLVARQQGEINALVIETLSEGVLIMDRQGTARAANPAALRLLGQGFFQRAPNGSLLGDPALASLVQLAQRSFMRGAQESGEPG
jgi:two-component system sensor histidine kinase PilS (NtrC family)